MNDKVIVSFRINEDVLNILEVLAELDNKRLSDELREAIDHYISFRTKDPKEKAKLEKRIAKIEKERLERQRKLLSR